MLGSWVNDRRCVEKCVAVLACPSLHHSVTVVVVCRAMMHLLAGASTTTGVVSVCYTVEHCCYHEDLCHGGR